MARRVRVTQAVKARHYNERLPAVPQMLVPIKVNLITGATGAGKSTAIRALLELRPAGERWAVLVNDFGDVNLNTGPGVAQGLISIREVVGCICCTAQVALRTAIVALLRDAAPRRLLIEVSSAAHPATLFALLREPGIAKAVELQPTLCVVDPSQVTDRRYASNEAYREQVAAADAILMSKSDITPEETRDRARAELEKISAAPVALIDAPGSIDMDCSIVRTSADLPHWSPKRLG
jgi:G3E family GTPase